MSLPDETGPAQAASAKGSRRTPFASREFVARVVSALALGAVVLLALIVGGWFFALVWLVAGIVGAAEWIAMSRTEPRLPVTLATGLTLAGLVAAIRLDAPGGVTIAIGVAGALAMLGLARGGSGKLNALTGLVGAAIIALVPPALRDDPGIGIVGPAWMFAIVWSTDIAAYFTGRSLGGPKLLPRVSPNKTWSGAVGGLVAGTLAGLGIVLYAREHGASALQGIALPAVAISSACASIVSQAGDLLESALKRRYGVKDSGRSIPGHGGVMDRLDGFFTVALLAAFYLIAQAAL